MAMIQKGLVLSGGGGRGAYQAGVYKYLIEKGFVPSTISGTSVGAINAVGLGCGLSADEMIELWKSINHSTVMSISYLQIVKDFFMRRFGAMVNPEPLRNFLLKNLDFQKLRNSPTSVYITAVNILNGELSVFGNDEITVDHILASAAIPMVFPWQQIGNAVYWDGGLMANTPILPLIERDIRDIIVVLLSPIGNVQSELPKNRKEAIERVFELVQIGSFQNFKFSLDSAKELSGATISDVFKNQLRGMLDQWLGGGDFRIRIVSPKTSLGIKSIMHFSGQQSDNLIKIGYEDAREQLGEVLD
jgi:NTE family protein